MTLLPDNIKSEWFSVVSRIQSVARAKNLSGYAVVKMQVLVDPQGNPKMWTEPEITKLEPKRLANMESITEIAKEITEQIITGMGS